MKSVKVYGVGDTIEKAKEDALLKLEKDYSSVEYEIIQMPAKKGLFGLFGALEAKVRAIALYDEGVNVKDFLQNIVEKFEIENLSIEQKETENGIVFDINGDNLGAMIGYRGETLNAIQYLTGLVANKEKEAFCKVTINAGDYRDKRDKAIENVARKNALRALRIRRNVYLEPMNSYERRIVHTVVQEIDGVKSWSEGEKRNRHAVIGLDNSKKAPKIDENNHSLYEKIN
ncbi:MAG: RNA-binding cell elongation regulator Jag/EloR [Clostridia bacterium]|nr:RNA-binding cell elongation regulator Jag/EloR [Clostridia bacterium]